MRPGNHPFRLCQEDKRFSYCSYVPETSPAAALRPLIVVVHGSFRVAESYRDAFIPLADKLGAVVLAPLFPCGVEGPDDTESYKFCVTAETRFDLALLAMIDDLKNRMEGELAADRFALFGYSGGGQFAHRFAYLHADRLAALSVGAPGKVTLMDEALPWWRGLSGLSVLAGQPLALEQFGDLPVQFVIGDRDNLEADVVTQPDSPHWMDGINDAGCNRIMLMESLRRSLAQHGVDARMDVVDGVGHDGFAVLEPVRAFFTSVLGPEANL